MRARMRPTVRDVDPLQLVQQCRRGLQFRMGSEVAGQPGQVGCETLSTDVVHAFGDDAESVVNLWPIKTNRVVGNAVDVPGYRSSAGLGFCDRAW